MQFICWKISRYHKYVQQMQLKCNSADSLVNSDKGGASCCVRWLYVAKLLTHEGTTAHIMGKRYQMIVTWNWQCKFLQICIVLNQHGRTWPSIREGKWWQQWFEFCLLSKKSVNKHNVCIQSSGCRELFQDCLKCSKWCGLIYKWIPGPCLDTMEKLQKATFSFVMSVHLPSAWNNAAPTDRFSWSYLFEGFF